MEKKGQFYETANVFGNKYGTPLDNLNSYQKEGKICLFNIDIKGATKFYKSKIQANYIGIIVQSKED